MSLFNYECDEIKRKIQEVSPNYPQLTTYTSEWLYFYENEYTPGTPVELEYETIIVNSSASVSNAIPYSYKSAILKGNTKYRDIDTGDILDKFDKTKNLELVSVQMPVLTTLNEDGTKTNTLTVNEEVDLRGIDNVQDELDLMTGEVVERIGEVIFDGSVDENWVLWATYPEESAIFKITKENSLKIMKAFEKNSAFKCNKFSTVLTAPLINAGGIYPHAISFFGGDNEYVQLRVYKSLLNSIDVPGLREYLTNEPITVQYKLATESVKIVDLTPLKKPYEGTNHYQLTSNIPCEAILEVPIVSTGEQTLKEINNN